ncbi:MAG: hypothetical protein A3K04_09535 [Gallionellales bacterium RBG_16_56_9]|nr:MAG: hypothetical protein A3K04_09535 [Gallionellales bacterium RBG_16_56_9]
MMKFSMYSQSQTNAGLLLLLLAIPIALVTGFISALGVKQLDMLWIAALGGVALLALSSRALIWSATILALLVVGQAIYFAGMGQAVWVPFGLGLLMYLRIPMVYANSPFSRIRLSPPLVYPVLIFMAAVLLSMLINTSQLFQAFRAAKSYIFLWSIFFIIAYWGVRLDTLERIWRFCIVVAFIQLPLVLYQYLFVASKRSNLGGLHGVSWDAIVGGFGGNPMGGGASGTMAWFLVFASVLCIALFRRNLISKWLLSGVLATSAICVGMAEVKVVVLLLPFGMGALLIPYLRKNPFMVLLGLVISVVVVFAILVLYGYLHGKTGSFHFDILAILNDAFWYSLDPGYINFVTGEMGRLASIVHWWQENGLDDPLHTLFGHGPGASSFSGVFGAGEVARQYSFGINRSTLSIFLWDIGLTGVFSYLFIIVRGMVLAIKASKVANLAPFQAAVLEAIFGGLLMVLMMLPYGKDVTEVPALVVLLMLFLGYVSQSTSQLRMNSKPNNEHAP